MSLRRFNQQGFIRLGGRRVGVSGGGGGSGSFSNNFRAVVNFSGVSDFSTIIPYINLIKGSDRAWVDVGGDILPTDPRFNSNYEPANLTAGQSVDRLQWILDTYPEQVLKPGTYILRWTGAGSLTTGGISSTLVSANRRTFTVDNTTNYLVLTASAGPVTNISLCHVDHEALLDSGEILHPDFVTWLNSWNTVKAFRFLDILATNLSTVVNAADWTPLSHISWCRGNRGAPPEIIAEIAKKTNNAPVWTTMPYLATDAAMVALFQRMKTHYEGTYTIFAEGINEAWNFGFPGTIWLQETYGYTVQNKDVNGTNVPNTDAQTRLNSAYGHHILRVWTAADSVFGTGRVRLPAGGQTGFPQLMYWWSNYSDPAYYGGATVKSLMNARGHIIFTHYFSVQNSITHKQMCIDNWGTKTDDEWINAWKADMDAHTNAINGLYRTGINLHAGLGNNAPGLIYEGGCHDFIDRHSNSTNGWADFVGTVDLGTNSITVGATNYAGFSDLDQVLAPNQNIGAGLNAFGVWAFCRKIAGNRLRLYPTLSAAAADSGNTGAGAGTLIAGTYYLANITRHLAIQNKLFSLLQGARGLEIIQYVSTGLQLSGINIRNASLFAGPSQTRIGAKERFTYSFEATNKGVYTIGNETPYVNYLKGLNTV